VFASLGPEVGAKTEMYQRIFMRRGHKNNVSPIPTVATIGSPMGHEFLPAERGGAIAATPAPDKYFDLIDKGQIITLYFKKNPGFPRVLSQWINTDLFFCFTHTLEGNCTGGQGKKGIILAPAHIKPGMHPRATLANNDASGTDQLATVSFYPQLFRIAITTVPRTANPFFMGK
jgi:hypothetical protein